MLAVDVNFLLQRLPRQRCSDGHRMRPLDLLGVSSARRWVWDEKTTLELLGPEGASSSSTSSHFDDDA